MEQICKGDGLEQGVLEDKKSSSGLVELLFMLQAQPRDLTASRATAPPAFRQVRLVGRAPGISLRLIPPPLHAS
jgi:hypothetical protein